MKKGLAPEMRVRPIHRGRVNLTSTSSPLAVGLSTSKSLISLWEARSGLKMGPVAR
jgi:hypothetical protein